MKSASNQAPEATHEDRDSEHRHSHAATPHVLTRRKDTVRGCGHSRASGPECLLHGPALPAAGGVTRASHLTALGLEDETVMLAHVSGCGKSRGADAGAPVPTVPSTQQAQKCPPSLASPFNAALGMPLLPLRRAAALGPAVPGLCCPGPAHGGSQGGLPGEGSPPWAPCPQRHADCQRKPLLHREPEERHLDLSSSFFKIILQKSNQPLEQPASPLGHLQGRGYMGGYLRLLQPPRPWAEKRPFCQTSDLLDSQVLENRRNFWCPAKVG